MRRVKKKMAKGIRGVFSLVLLVIASLGSSRTAEASELFADFRNPTKCYLGICGHSDAYVNNFNPTQPYYVASTGTEYNYLKWFVEPGNSLSISSNYTYTSTVSGGAEIGIGICKLSLGSSGEWTQNYTVTMTLNNNTKCRMYAHSAVEYEERVSTGLRVNRRIFSPYSVWGAGDRYCEYDEKVGYPSVRVADGSGMVLLATKVSTPNISIAKVIVK